jgi:hypothetical protein
MGKCSAKLEENSIDSNFFVQIDGFILAPATSTRWPRLQIIDHQPFMYE